MFVLQCSSDHLFHCQVFKYRHFTLRAVAAYTRDCLPCIILYPWNVEHVTPAVFSADVAEAAFDVVTRCLRPPDMVLLVDPSYERSLLRIFTLWTEPRK